MPLKDGPEGRGVWSSPPFKTKNGDVFYAGTETMMTKLSLYVHETTICF